MSVPMPAAVVLILCKTVAVPYSSPTQEANAAQTGHQKRAWATEHSKMVCRRQEVRLHDQSEAMGAAAQPFNVQRCQRAGLTLGAQWDANHPHSVWRFWRAACPVPVVDTRTGAVIAWTMPGCGKRDVVTCEGDTEI